MGREFLRNAGRDVLQKGVDAGRGGGGEGGEGGDEVKEGQKFFFSF